MRKFWCEQGISLNIEQLDIQQLVRKKRVIFLSQWLECEETKEKTGADERP